MNAKRVAAGYGRDWERGGRVAGAGKTNKSSRNSFALDSDSIKSKEAEASQAESSWIRFDNYYRHYFAYLCAVYS